MIYPIGQKKWFKIKKMNLIRINLLERLPKEDSIYVIDLFINKLVENDSKTYEWKEYKNNGRNSYTGKVLLKIILY